MEHKAHGLLVPRSDGIDFHGLFRENFSQSLRYSSACQRYNVETNECASEPVLRKLDILPLLLFLDHKRNRS
jgi:hypothetical protein